MTNSGFDQSETEESVGGSASPNDEIVTVRRELEQRRAELLESETRYQSLIESAHGFAWEVDAGGTYTYLSHQVTDILGYTPEEMIGTTPFDLMPADEAQRIGAEFGAIVAKAEAFRDLENVNIHKNGSRVALETNGVPLFDHSGALTGYLGMDRDVTQREQDRETLARDQRLLAGLAGTTQRLLAGRLLTDQDITEALGVLATTVGADRAYLVEHEQDREDSRGFFSQRCEWSTWGAKPPIDDPEPQRAGWDDLIPLWYDTLVAGGLISGDVADFSVQERAALEPRGILSLLIVPIRLSGQLKGFMGFGSCSATRAWNPSEIIILEAAANALGSALARHRLMQEEHEQRVFAETLRDVTSSLSRTYELETVMDRVFDRVSTLVDYDAADIMLEDESDGLFRVVRSSSSYFDPSTEEANRGLAERSLADTPLFQRMRERCSEIAVADLADSPLWDPTHRLLWARAYAGAPILIRGRLIGFLNAYSRTPGQFETKHADRLRALADQAAVAIDSSRMHESLERLATTDALTGVFNRHGLSRFADREVNRANRLGTSVAVVMVDVDNFKSVNDRFGHSVGDELLCVIARSCLGQARAIDVLARFGGDEFVMLLPDTDTQGAHVVADRIRDSIANELARSSIGTEELRATVSAGIAAGAGPGLDLNALYAQADQGLYAAKEAGRNRVMVG